MVIGLHDAEQDYFKLKTFPNLALMKISSWHKARGDSVEWWIPILRYDRVYSSKVFDFTPDRLDTVIFRWTRSCRQRLMIYTQIIPSIRDVIMLWGT